MKKNTKLLAAIMIGVVSLTIFTATIDGNSVEAKRINGRTNYVEKNKSIEREGLLNPADYGTTYESDIVSSGQYQTRAGGTWFVKKSIKVILNNKYKAANAIERIAGNRAKQEFLKSFHSVEPQLRELLRWSDIPSQAIYDAVYRGMRAAGSSNYYATKVAHGIKQAVGWLL